MEKRTDTPRSTGIRSSEVYPRSSVISGTYETHKPHLTMMSWKAIFAGFFISVFASLILTSLGVGFGGLALSDLEVGKALGWGTALWMILTVLVSLFAGSYIASRVSNFLSREVGMAQGATIAALFFAVSIWGGGMFVGTIARTAAVVTKGVASIPVADLAENAYRNPQVKNVVNQQVRELGIAPSRVDDVIAASLSRLLDGDTDGAERVIAANTNLDRQLVHQRVVQLEETVKTYSKQTAKDAAQAVAAAGISMFLLLILGGGAAIFGGISGSRANARHSLEEDEILRVA